MKKHRLYPLLSLCVISFANLTLVFFNFPVMAQSDDALIINDGIRSYHIWRDNEYMAKIQYQEDNNMTRQTKNAKASQALIININHTPLRHIKKLSIVPRTNDKPTHSIPKSVDQTDNALFKTVFAPVYYTKPDRQGERLIFSGQAIVTPPKHWDVDKVSDWATQHAITQLTPLTFSRQTRYRVKLDDGEAGIQQLRNIAAQGEVIIVPDWRRKKSTR